MTFMRLPSAATIGTRRAELLSADNGPAPAATGGRFAILAPLRRAADAYGLRPGLLATLEVLLSCLPADLHHHRVFASNATLALRRNGITDRTLRRHIAELESRGFIARVDSANRKRFTRSNPLTGEVLRFGFDLTPLFLRRDEIEASAEAADREAQAIRFLKARIRAAVQRVLLADPDATSARETLRALRRKLDLDELRELLTRFSPEPVEILGENRGEPSISSATDGQIVRHHQRSKEDLLEFDGSTADVDDRSPEPAMKLAEVLAACPAAGEFALEPLRSWPEAARHAWTLAPMMGVDRSALLAAEDRLGPERSAATLFAVLQMQGRISSMGGYFRALTSGRRSAGFQPWTLIRRLLQQPEPARTC